MSFEIKDRDLLARIGSLQTKSGPIETPVLLPVINPAIQPIQPKVIQTKFRCSALITNAYIIKKHFNEQATNQGIHTFLDYTGSIMTDSGAYQALVYGDVEVTSKEIVRYQEDIDTDIATILDLPTGWKTTRERATYTVNETLKRARELAEIKTREDILWVGPVQGGRHLELVARSAKSMGELPFQIHALGSPTPVMEQYLFDTLVDMILTAKMALPLQRPLHLFGAGHPFMFALAVALGCDLFDSAAYAIYAREDRYLTEYGTSRLGELEYFPCSCPVCVHSEPEKFMNMEAAKKQEKLAQHNLFVSLSELRRIKQAIVEGCLWEHLELRAHGHPALLKGVKNLRKYAEYLEKQSPVTKKRGLSFFGSLDLTRPEVIRHRKRLLARYSPPQKARSLVLLPQTQMKPFHKSRECQRALKRLVREIGDGMERVHLCTYAAPFGVVPAELDEVYPLSQHEITTPLDSEILAYVAGQIERYIAVTDYEMIVVLLDQEVWKGKVRASCEDACRKKYVPLRVVEAKSPWDEDVLGDLAVAVSKALPSTTQSDKAKAYVKR